MATTTVAYDIIARDLASKAFRNVAASAKEQQVAVTKAFAEQDAAAKRARSSITASLRAQEAEQLKAAKAAEKYGAATAAINKHSAGISKVAGTLAKVGGAVAVGFGLAVKASSDFNAEMARVGAFSDDARAHMGELRKLALTVGTSMGYSGTQAADAMEEMVKAGISATDMINGGLKGALALAAAGQIDVSQATSIAAAAMTNFSLTGKDIPHLADLLAAGADKALGGVGDLGEAMTYAGTQAHQYGLKVEETVGTLAAFAQNGQLGSVAGTEFAEVLTRLGAPTGKAAGVMKELHLSAYDANGDFVDMSTLAGRLKKAFDGLTPAQRNAYEQTIFGQRAVRGANILIKEGASGITDWIKKVNDQGFAAQTASRKLDSLNGDLIKLKAAFTNALIGAGNSGQGPLRKATQALTQYIDDWNRLPDSAKNNIEKVVLGLGALSLGGSAVLKVIQGVASIRKAFIDLGNAGRLAKAGFGFGGLALAGITTAIALFVQQEQKAHERAAEFGDAFQEMEGKINGATVALNKNIRAVAYSQLNQEGAIAAAKQLHISLSDVTSATLGNDKAMQRVALAMDAATQSGEAQYASTRSGTRDITSNARAADKLGSAIGLTKTAIKSAAQAEKDRRAAMSHSKEATDSSAKSTTTLAQKTAVATQKIKDESQALDEQRKALIAAGDAAIAASNSQIAFKQSVHDAEKAVKDNGHTLDLNTQKGRDNKTALNGLASSTLSYVQDLIKNHASTEKLTAAMQDGRQAFIRVAEQMGKTKEQAKKLADQYHLQPKVVSTLFKQPGMTNAQRQAKALKQDLEDMRNRAIAIKYTVTAGGSEVHFSSGAVAKFAEGGRLHGPGTSTSDSILMRGSRDEYMIKADSAKSIGYHRLNYMNQTGNIPGFASGGRIGRTFDLDYQFPAAAGPVDKFLKSTQDMIQNSVGKGVKEAIGAIGGGGAAVPLGGSGLVSWHGGTFTQNFARHLQMAYAMAPFQVMQGGWNPGGVAASGTTHDEDAVDASPATLAVQNALRAHGVAAWIRTPAEGFVYHVHGVPLPGAGTPSPQAAWQAQDYLRGGNGLLHGGMVTKDGIYPLSENGRPELVVGPQAGRLNAGSRVFNADQTAGLLGGGIMINVYGDLLDSDDFIRKIRRGLDQYDRRRGAVTLTRRTR